MPNHILKISIIGTNEFDNLCGTGVEAMYGFFAFWAVYFIY